MKGMYYSYYCVRISCFFYENMAGYFDIVTDSCSYA